MKRLWLPLLLLVLMVADLFLGSVSLSASDVWAALWGHGSSDIVQKIVWNFRFPKMVTALLASSGAGLGVAFFVMGSSLFGVGMLSVSWMFDLGTAAFAWMGALAVMLLVLAASRRLKSNMSLLILGIMTGSAASALIGLIQYFSDAPALKSYMLWTMGSFGNVTGARLLIMTVLCLSGLLISVYNIKDLNVLLMGEEYAQNLGISLTKVRNRIFLATTLLAGSVTAFCGPIGFIGIAVPHISRMLFRNANHRILIPAAALTGACMMILADIISQLPGTQSVLPVNTVAALMGIPVIIYVIFKNRAVDL